LPSDVIADRTDDDLEITDARVAHLEEMVAARDRFLAIAAHELRNPMAPLVLQIGLLLKSARKGELPRVIEGLELLETIIARYVKRANVLLDVSRLATDRIKLEPAPLDLAEWIRHIASGFAAVADLANSELKISSPDALPAIIDRMAVEQILENLLSNAIKFGAGKPVMISVVPAGNAVCIAVRDHGPGISPRDHARIFAPFEKIMTREQGGGFGVGLWVVGRLVGEMGGAVELDSSPGNGATFRVTLPLNQ
jgi:two-component system OmpR family sensor kinase